MQTADIKLMCHIDRKQLMQHPQTVCLLYKSHFLTVVLFYRFSKDFQLHILQQYTKSYKYEDVPADRNRNVEDRYSSSACVVCKQICYDCRCYCRVAPFSNANKCSKQYENYKVLQIISTYKINNAQLLLITKPELSSCTNMLTNTTALIHIRKCSVLSPLGDFY